MKFANAIRASMFLNPPPTHDEAAARNPNISRWVSKAKLSCFAHLVVISQAHEISLRAGDLRQAPMIPRNSARSDSSRTSGEWGEWEGEEGKAVGCSVVDRQWEGEVDARIRRMEKRSRVFRALQMRTRRDYARWDR